MNFRRSLLNDNYGFDFLGKIKLKGRENESGVYAVRRGFARAVSCNGNSDGSASVIVNGGTPPYSYNWSPAGGSSMSATNLAAGNYTVTVTDAHGCIATTGI